MAYLLDANVFIQAKNLHYGFDFCPAFWEWLIASNAAQRVYSIDKVGDEVHQIEDELSTWANDRGPTFFLPLQESVLPSLAAVSLWASSGGRYEPGAVTGFLQVADYYLVAFAHAGQHTVVTHEIPSASRKKIKIPDACIGMRVRFMTPYEMLRREHARFLLGTQP